MSDQLQRFRSGYHAVRAALPWLDVDLWPDESNAFGVKAADTIPFISSLVLTNPLLLSSDDRPPVVYRYVPDVSGPLDQLDPVLRMLAKHRIPLAVYHTNLTADQVEQLARRHESLPILIATGPRKLLYHISDFERLLGAFCNVNLCTANLSNWMGLERLAKAGLSSQLIFAGKRPQFGVDAAMGPIVLGQLPWTVKCDIAGNNLRRLVSQPPVTPDEVMLPPVTPFIIDMHTHNINQDDASGYDFPTPDQDMSPADWVHALDAIAVDVQFLMPSSTLTTGEPDALTASQQLRDHAPQRFRFYEIYDPRISEKSLERAATSLKDPACVGIKIHPSFHNTPADNRSYDAVFDLAASAGVPIISHTWEISSYNESQQLSHPQLFKRHLERHPDLKLIMAHAGGRASTFDDVVQICEQYKNVVVDISGDYFEAGLLAKLLAAVEPGRVLYGSDLNWIDPRCTLGLVLGSSVSDEDALAVLRSNALAYWGDV